MKFRFLLFRQNPSTSGFTLIELLIAVSLTTIATALAGFGMVAIMQANQRSESEIARRTQLNRSLEFIADEIRMAKVVNVPTSANVPTPTCGTATGVLDLTMPNNSRVVYYVNNIGTCAKGLWSQPATIRRVSNGVDTLLVDAIAPATTPPTCNSATSTGSNGFYACIDSASKQLVTLYLYGKLSDAYGDSNATYEVSSKAFARSQ